MKKCKQGYYYCYKDKKCKKIPLGYRIGLGGWLRKEKEEETEEGKKKNGNGNGSNGNGNGNGESNGGSNGGGVSEAWSSKYKKSIDCDNPKGFSQRAHCRGRKKVSEEAVSRKQQKFFGIVRAIQKGELEPTTPETAKAAVTMKKSDVKKFASTKHEGLPERKKMTEQTCSICNCDPCQCLEGNITEARDGKSAKDKGYSLRDWFKGGGWKQTGGKYDGKPCAKQPGQKTKPYCRDADDRAAMSKEERNKRARKKRKEDPNPNRKGKAKNVTQESYSNWREELKQLDEAVPLIPLAIGAGAAAIAGGMYFGKKASQFVDKHRKTQPNDYQIKRQQGFGGASLSRMRTGGLSPEQLRQLNQSYQPEGEVVEGYDEIRPYDRIKMGDGKLRTIRDIDAKLKDKKPVQKNSFEPEGDMVDEGKKDACYHKVKSRYSVWPSAYASGALVKCRKVGAKNWGNKTKKESVDYSNWRDDFQALEIETIDLIKADPIEVPPSRIDIIKEGAKKKNQVRVTNVGDTLKKSVDNQIMTDPELKLIKKKFVDLDKAHYEPEGEVLDEKCWKGYEKKGMKTMFGKRYPNCVKKKKTRKEEFEVSEGKYTRGEIYKKGTAPHRDPVAGESYPKEIYKKKVRLADEVELGEMKNGGDNDPCWDTHKQVGMKKKGGKMVPNCVPKNEEYSNWRDELEEGAAWTKKEGKNKSGGLNEKGRKSYERENPGSDLKRPSKKVGNKRRKSFCARMKGMKKKLTSKKTANDPDSRINKSLRAWNC